MGNKGIYWLRDIDGRLQMNGLCRRGAIFYGIPVGLCRLLRFEVGHTH